MIFNTPQTREGRQQLLKTLGYQGNIVNSSRYLDNANEFAGLIQSDEKRIYEAFTGKDYGRNIGGFLNVYNSGKSTQQEKDNALNLFKQQAPQFAENLQSSYGGLFEKLNTGGFLKKEAADLYNSTAETYKKYAGANVKLLGDGKATVSEDAFITQSTGADSKGVKPVVATAPATSTTAGNGDGYQMVNGQKKLIPGGAADFSNGTPVNSKNLIDKALATPKQSTQDLQQYDWWKGANVDVKKGAFKEIEKIIGSPEAMANYVMSKGLTDLQNYDWWSTSPHKDAAWKIIQSKVGGNQAQSAQGQAGLNPIDQINQEANAAMESELATIQSETSKVDLSNSAELTQKLIQALESKANEPQVSLADEFDKKRAELGVGKLESELSSIDGDIKKLDADYASTLPEEENRRVSVAQIGRRENEISLQYNRQRRDLIAERDSIAGELNTKYGVINSMVNLMGQDIDNARQDYNDKFDQALKMIDLVKGVEQDQKDAAQQRTDNAQANLTVMANLLKEGNVNYADLDPTTLLDIRRMEMEAGLPVGFTSFIKEAVEAPVVSMGTAFNDDNGKRILPVFTRNADGSFEITNVEIGNVEKKSDNSGTPGVGVGGSGSKGSPQEALDIPDGEKGGQCGRYVNNYTKLRLGDTYQSKLDEMDKSIKKPEEGMVFVMPYKNTGHTGFIVNPSVNADGEPVENGKYSLVKDSNWGLDERVQTHVILNSKFTGFQRVWSDEEPNKQAGDSSAIDAAFSIGFGDKPVAAKNNSNNNNDDDGYHY